jgi:hypothetical protein
MLSPADMEQFDLASRSSVEEPIGMAQVTLFGSSLPCNRSHDIRWPLRVLLFPSFDVRNNTISVGSRLHAWSGTHLSLKQVKWQK